MPRQVRIEFPGAIYHVMCRGDRREAIFEDDKDRERFIETLHEAASRAGWIIHAFVLMGNLPEVHVWRRAGGEGRCDA